MRAVHKYQVQLLEAKENFWFGDDKWEQLQVLVLLLIAQLQNIRKRYFYFLCSFADN